MPSDTSQELKEALDRVLDSSSRKKLVVAGPGSGKTYLFKELLKRSDGGREERLVLTFIKNLKADLDRNLGEMAAVATLHGYCQSLLHGSARLRGGLTADFVCYPGLVSLIKKDWSWTQGSEAPEFVKEMRSLECPDDHFHFYAHQSDYYDAVDFDDSVYRAYKNLETNPELIPPFKLVLIDEFQDFNRMEAGIIAQLGATNPIVMAGDDDQALYSQLRGASWEYIRSHYGAGEYTVFSLPFCMRCPEVVVEAVNDIISRARAERKLEGRIDKPFRFFEPVKGADSRRFPNIDLVQTSVQRQNANYFARYIEQCIRAIPAAEVEEAKEKHEPVALIIGSKPYLPQIAKHLVEVGLISPQADDELSERDVALEILKGNPNSNLGWRIILSLGTDAIAAPIIRRAYEEKLPLADVLPREFRDPVLVEASAWTKPEAADEVPVESIRLTSYEGSKGMSAQYVFLVGLHEGELPRNTASVADIEICRFLVGLTRTKKLCSLMITQRFGNDLKSPSPFLGWIRDTRFNVKRITAAYWR